MTDPKPVAGVEAVEPKLFTLAEAREVLKHDICLEVFGEHDFQQVTVLQADGRRILLGVDCYRCRIRLMPEHQCVCP